MFCLAGINGLTCGLAFCRIGGLIILLAALDVPALEVVDTAARLERLLGLEGDEKVVVAGVWLIREEGERPWLLGELET